VKKTYNRHTLVLDGKAIVLGVTGSIAAYKAVSLARRFLEQGAVVDVVMTSTAQRFVQPLTFEVLTGRPVSTELFARREGARLWEHRSQQAAVSAAGTQQSDRRREGADIGYENDAPMPHLSLADKADLIVIAPATAHCVAKLAHGLADDLLSTMVLASTCPILIAPAMDGGMWEHPAVRSNVRTLRARNVTVMEPETGPLASGSISIGRFPDEQSILTRVAGLLASRKDFRGRRVLVTAGPTQESLDPVRFLSNRSSGKMGWAVAEAARDRGADVTLIAGPTGLSPVPGVSMVSVVSSEEMRKAVMTRFSGADVLIMAAAVADFRCVRPAPGKIAKGSRSFTLSLEPTADILAELPRERAGQLVVGFAAETGELIDRARRKLHTKNMDLIVANNVSEAGSGFGSDTNRVTLLDRHGRCEALPLLSKRVVADRILDAVTDLTAGDALTPKRHRRRLRNPYAR
jgi:phosphopantothenoylcysteine decarboxylase/phosphopantothenate--cysteine ligase